MSYTDGLREELERRVQQDIHQRDLAMSRLEGEITRELQRSGLTVLEALTVLTLAAGRLASDGVREERADETEIAPVKVDWLANPMNGSKVPPEKVITPDPVPDVDRQRERELEDLRRLSTFHPPTT
jgi:hypothetical protein